MCIPIQSGHYGNHLRLLGGRDMASALELAIVTSNRGGIPITLKTNYSADQEISLCTVCPSLVSLSARGQRRKRG